jgi:hypothetical protein
LSSVSGSEISAISTLGLLPSARQAQKNAFAFKRCRSAFQKRTMIDEPAKTKPEKLPKTKAELEDLVLAELRAASDCAGAVHVTVVAYDDYRVGASWEVASCNAGASAPEDCERALCDIVGRLQQHFDITPT